jgi:hypothetical protein
MLVVIILRSSGSCVIREFVLKKILLSDFTLFPAESITIKLVRIVSGVKGWLKKTSSLSRI